MADLTAALYLEMFEKVFGRYAFARRALTYCAVGQTVAGQTPCSRLPPYLKRTTCRRVWAATVRSTAAGG
ncbi:hypothetical protein [Burkholderia diffusa]|uniref:hypothetical protein n=1 Tax=Burkholderia diffusa TaxID=488732 RepID=UPI003B58B3DC